MAGIVIIDNKANLVRQAGETAASWLLRGGLYKGTGAPRAAHWEREAEMRNEQRISDYLGSSVQGDSFRSNADSALYTENTYRKRGYSAYPFLEGVPYNNVILETAEKSWIEFVDAKVKVSKSHTIVETATVSRNGTVKEYINANDYVIDIDASVSVPYSNAFPYELVRSLNKLLSSVGELFISNTYCGLFDIHRVIFMKGDFDQKGQKFTNIMPVILQFKSDDENYGLIMDMN
jgi:hypothetical protein